VSFTSGRFYLSFTKRVEACLERVRSNATQAMRAQNVCESAFRCRRCQLFDTSPLNGIVQFHAVDVLRRFGMASALTKPRMCNMSTIQSEQQRLGANKFRAYGSSLGTSAAVKLIELGIALAEASDSIPGFCFYCLSPRNTHSSTAQFPNVFCSEQCEQTFICGPLASLTTEDCIRRYKRLKNLLM
jgi:hypothetical protein